jgi:large subunit ribosomal protein L18Ae
LIFKFHFCFVFKLKQYRVVGRRLPEYAKVKNEQTPLYQMKIFANNKVQAKSRFWYFIALLKNIKTAHGEIVACDEVKL